MSGDGHLRGADRVSHRLENDWDTARNSSAGWPQFLESVEISGLRGWTGESVEFRFPIVAVAGENGSGKSTVLKAAAAAYRCETSTAVLSARTFYPDDFFPNTPWEKVSGVNIRYRVRRGDHSGEHSLRKLTRRWRGMPERPERAVFFLDISRTQPIDSLVGYAKIAKAATFIGDEVDLTAENRGLLARVMSRSYVESKVIRHAGKQVGVLELGGNVYSNFHQGAGEDATTDLVVLLQEVPRHSLIVIDEVESSLHPRAQRRLMTELINVSRDRRLQFILSTHSPYVLEQLPTEARVYIQTSRSGVREVIYGVTPDFALSLMDDVGHPELTLFCEDARAAVLLDRLISANRPEILRRLQIIAVGPADTVKSLGRLGAHGLLPTKSIGILDGDQPSAEGCLVLPGGASPESTVFRSMNDSAWEEVAVRLGVRPGDLLDAVEDAMRLGDEHAWPGRVAERLGPRVRSNRIWEDAAAVWSDDVVDSAVAKEFVELIADAVV